MEEAEEAFLTRNAKNSGIRVTSSGLQYEVLEEGSGLRPSAFSTVKVHYEGRLIDGTVFDSTVMHGRPEEFPLDRVIPGFAEGIQFMSIGSKYRFFIPSHLAYGPYGFGPIPGFTTLVMEVELLDILD